MFRTLSIALIAAAASAADLKAHSAAHSGVGNYVNDALAKCAVTYPGQANWLDREVCKGNVTNCVQKKFKRTADEAY